MRTKPETANWFVWHICLFEQVLLLQTDQETAADMFVCMILRSVSSLTTSHYPHWQLKESIKWEPMLRSRISSRRPHGWEVTVAVTKNHLGLRRQSSKLCRFRKSYSCFYPSNESGWFDTWDQITVYWLQTRRVQCVSRVSQSMPDDKCSCSPLKESIHTSAGIGDEHFIVICNPILGGSDIYSVIYDPVLEHRELITDPDP